MVCHNPQFDYSFLRLKAKKYNLDFPFPYKCFDLHSIAAVKYNEINGRFFINEDNESGMSSSAIFEFCGIQDERIRLKEGKVVKEGKPHNGLEDAKIEAECFSRLIYGKNLLPEFKNYLIPEYLKLKVWV